MGPLTESHRSHKKTTETSTADKTYRGDYVAGPKDQAMSVNCLEFPENAPDEEDDSLRINNTRSMDHSDKLKESIHIK